MYTFKRSRLILLPILASLLLVTLLLPSFLRPIYLYFIINLLFIAICAGTGLLSSLLPNPNPSFDDRKLYVSPTPPPNGPRHDVSVDRDNNNNVIAQEKEPNKVVEKCNSEKIAGGGGRLKAAITEVKKRPSTQSIFFIGRGETQSPEAAREESEGEEQEEEEVAGISSQELFTKAENFIGNFHKQLKMEG